MFTQKSIWLTAVALSIPACGGSEVSTFESPDTSSSTTPTSIESTTSAPGDQTGSSDLTAVEESVVRIIADGAYEYPADGALIEAGAGSGFVISEGGLVLTNNHVVAGAAIIKVKVGAATSDVTASVVARSECDDLAVVQLPPGTYSPMALASTTPPAGTPIFSAGFPPSGDDFESSTYTVTRGVISTTVPNGESSWASVGEEIEHDAHTRGGNSGGPLFTDDGTVVGVNYAGDDELGTNYAVAVASKQALIASLMSGSDVTAIGINGGAMFSDENGTGFTGVWVYGVESGSVAERAGIRPGDLILSLEGLPVAEDGTMSTYCDVLRTQGIDAVISVEVYRAETDAFLSGQFNGEQLSEATGIADQYTDADVSAGISYAEYTLITDDSGTIEVEVPAAWDDTDGAYDNDFGGPSIWASTNLQDFWEYYGVPGVAIDTTRDSSQSMYSILNDIDYSLDCVDDGILEYDDGIYSGYTRLWVNCPDNTAILVLAALPESQRFIVRLEAQIVSDADFEALDRILASFYVYEE